MARFQVTSGDMDETVESADADSAVIEALQRRNWTGLGVITRIASDGIEDAVCLTTLFLDKAGFTEQAAT